MTTAFKRNGMRAVLCVVLSSLTSVLQAAGSDWPQWRGPQRDGQVVGFVAPEAWPKELQRKWKIEIGIGHSSPVVAGDRVYTFSREGEEEVVRSVSLGDGRQIWSAKYPAPYKVNMFAMSHGKGPKSTPAVADGRLFTLGISGILSAWDADKGTRLWQQEFSKTYPSTSPLYGTAMSPVVDGNLLIAHVGGHNGGALMALDVHTGKLQWQWNGDGPGYASPVIVSLGSVRQVITQSQDAVIAVSPADGSLLWKMPYKTVFTQNIVTPAVAGDLLLIGGTGKPTAAYRIEQSDGKWTPKQVWENKEIPMYMSSPVVVGGRIVGLTERKKGAFFCLDPATGKTLWTSDGRMGENAAIVAAGDIAFALTTESELIVLKPAVDTFAPLARYKVADTPTWAHPVLVGRQVLVKDKTNLALWTW